jgi:hypothetical protein
MENLNLDMVNLINQISALGWLDTLLPLLPLLKLSLTSPLSRLLVRFFLSQPLPKSTIQSNIAQAWKFLKSLITEDRDDGLMVFTFEDLDNLNRVLEDSPWNIKGSPMFLRKWYGMDAIEDLDFTKANYWVQVHNLPLELVTIDNASSIGASLGELLCIDNVDNMKPSRKIFLRFHVCLNLLNPLVPGFIHHRPPKAPIWV